METTTLIYILVCTVAVLAVVVALLVWRLFHKNDELKAKNEVIIRELRRNQTLIDRAVSLGIKRTSLLITLAAFCIVLTTACHHDTDSSVDSTSPDQNKVERIVAVVAPLSDVGTKQRLERTAQWFTDNFSEAQQGDSINIELKIEWYDELSENLTALSGKLAGREDVLAVIGPFGNDAMASFAPGCQQKCKPLIAPTVTSDELMRRYAVSSVGRRDLVNKDAFFWPLCESDIVLTETLLSHYATTMGKNVESTQLNSAMFSPADVYGQTFYDWTPFHARNMNIDLKRNVQYTTMEALKAALREYLEEAETDLSETLLANNFCVIESTRQLCDVVRTRHDLLKEHDVDDTQADSWKVFEGLNRTWFVFPGLSQEGIDALGKDDVQLLQGYQGFMPYADATTGFEAAYVEHFAATPTFAECKFYDALLLTGIAAYLYEYLYARYQEAWKGCTGNELMNAMIITTAMEPEGGISSYSQPAWRGAALRGILGGLRKDVLELPVLCGACGHIVFDLETCSQLGRTTYVQWQIVDGHIQHNIYYGPQGKQVVNTNASLNFIYDEDAAQKDFADMSADTDLGIGYPAMSDQYAVLIQGSKGIDNYRHQSDVLSVYQLLRKGGFDDDHIILILDSELAHNAYNKEPGIIRTDIMGPDLLGGSSVGSGLPAAVVDYDSDSLSVADICDILIGRSSAHLPVTLPPASTYLSDERPFYAARRVPTFAGSSRPNVFLFWSGHGRNKTNNGVSELSWRDLEAGQGMTASLLRQTAEQVSYRKLLTIVETCYAEGVIQSLQGLTGVLAMAGAGADEQSWADNWNPNMGRYGGLWMCDRFTLNVVRCLNNNASTTYRDLYLYCMRNTIGSHVKLVNAVYFGNLYRTSPEEFIVKK